MPKRSQGQKRPADSVACAVMVAQIATGEIEADPHHLDDAQEKKAGALARKSSLPAERRSVIAEIAAEARWRRHGGD